MTVLSDLWWMLPPLAMCLVLTGMHGYLGIHVLSRKVIFVDLALAQIAALGTAYAFMLGYDPRAPGDGVMAYVFSLGFTFIGAAVFALTRMRHEKVPQEAFIGITYAAASALAILLIAKLPGESEHIKEMLVGNVLLVTWPAVLKTTLIYAAIGAFHFVFRKPFLEISANPEEARARGRRVRLWDFAFYASFGFVITSSVAVAGVLLVFSFLVVPAVVAFMFREDTTSRILVAWTVGTLCSAAGMLVSYYGDLPTAPSVVASFAALLGLAGAVYFWRGSARRLNAALQVGVGVLLVVGLVWLSTFLRKGAPEHAHTSELEALAAALIGSDETAQIEAVHHLAKLGDPHTVAAFVQAIEKPSSPRVLEHVLEALPELGEAAHSAVPALERLAKEPLDHYLRFELASTLLALKSASGFAVLGSLVNDQPPLLVARQVDELLHETTGRRFGLGAEPAAERERAVTRFHAWLLAEGDKLRWRPERKRFE